MDTNIMFIFIGKAVIILGFLGLLWKIITTVIGYIKFLYEGKNKIEILENNYTSLKEYVSQIKNTQNQMNQFFLDQFKELRAENTTLLNKFIQREINK